MLQRAAVTLGVPVFLDEVVAPAVEDIGHGWAERSLSVAQEHMAPPCSAGCWGGCSGCTG